MSNERMMLGWQNHAEAATVASATPAQTDRGVTNAVNRRPARTFKAQASSRRQMSITLDLGATYSQNLARMLTLTRHVLGTTGRFRVQAGNVAALGDPDALFHLLADEPAPSLTLTHTARASIGEDGSSDWSSDVGSSDLGVTNAVNRRPARTFKAQASSRRQMSITLDLGATYSQNLARMLTLTRHVLGTTGRFRVQAGNVADLGDPDALFDLLADDLDPRITFTRASTKAYFDADGVLQFAASGVFPLDHRPITGRRRGRLPEGAATNLRTRSCEFTNAAYSEDGATSLDNLATAPVGTLTAGLLLEDGSNGAHTQTDDVTITADTVYAVSRWFRAGGRPQVELKWGDTGGDRKSPRLNSSH